MGGFPLGDLFHWFPDEYEQWKTQENAEHARISHWLNTGSDSIFTTVDRQSDGDIPKRFKLCQNYPNPFNPTTRITYSVPKYSYLSLKVYNQLGQEVTTLFEGYRETGNYHAIFDGSGLPSGIYFYQMRTEHFVKMKKLMLLK